MAKRFFIGSSIFFLAILLLWGLYALFFSPAKPEVAVTPPSPEIPQEILPASNAITVAIDAPILSPSLSSAGEGTILFVDKNTGTLEKFNIASESKEVLAQETLTAPINAVWQKSGAFVFAKEFRSNEVSFRLFHIGSSDAPVALKWGVRYLIWDELGENILYTFQDPSGKMTLNKSLPNGSEWKELAKLPANPVLLASIPKTPLVAFWGKPSNLHNGELKTVNITNGDTKTLYPGKYGANYLWSPNGEKILMSWAPEKNGSKTALATLNKNGGEYVDLNFPTIVDKCVWSKNSVTVFCALPGSLPQGAVMPDIASDPSLISNDTFWKIDTQTGKSERVIPLESMVASYNASELLLSPDESTLFFLNRKDAKLYSIDL